MPSKIIIVTACLLSCFLLPAVNGIQTTHAQDDWPEIVQGKLYKDRDVVVPGADFRLALEAHIAKDYHINSHSPGDEFLIPTMITAGDLPGFSFQEPIYPLPQEKTYEFSDEPMAVYEGTVYFGIPARAQADLEPGVYPLKVTLSYQPCDQMACYPPEEENFQLDLKVAPLGEAMTAIDVEVMARVHWGGPEPTAKAPGEDQFADLVRQRGLLLALAVVFVGGLALNLTPCVFPIIPITISFFSSQSGGRASSAFRLSVAYFLGITLCFSALGTIAALTGSLFGALLQNPLVLVIIAAVLVYLALSMFGLYQIPLFNRLQSTTGGARKGLAGAFLMGLTVGLAASPCIGPFVLGLLVFVGNAGDPFLGFLIFFTLAAGLGLPYIVLGTFSGMLAALPRAGTWMEVVKKILAVILFGLVFYFLRPLLGRGAYPWAFAGYLVAGGIVLLLVRTAGELKGLRIVRQLVAVVFLVWGLYSSVNAFRARGAGGSEWTSVADSTQLHQALSAGQPAVVHFTADWCAVCHELEAKTYRHPEVMAAAKGFHFLRVDLTSEDQAKKELRLELGVRGLPTVLFFDDSGRERPELRQSGFIEPDRFLQLLEMIQQR